MDLSKVSADGLSVPFWRGNPLPMLTFVDQTTTEVAKSRLNRGAYFDGADGQTVLQRAAMASDRESVVEILLTAKADVEMRDEKGRTALHRAAITGNLHAIEILLRHQANINSLDSRNLTPLVLAFDYDQVQSTKKLLQAGAETIGFSDPRVWHAHSGCQLQRYTKATAYGLGNNPISREILAALAMAGSLEFNGQLPFQGGVLDLESGATAYYSQVMLESFQAFAREYPGLLSESEIATVSMLLNNEHGLSMRNAEVILQKIHSGMPVRVPTGYTGHAVEILILGDYLIICNKSSPEHGPGQVRKIDRQQFTLEKVKQMLYCVLQSQAYYEAWNRGLASTLGAQMGPLTFFEPFYPMEPRMRVGICSYANVETLVFFALAALRFSNAPADALQNLISITRVQDIFVRWVRFTQLRTVEKYFEQVDAGQIPYNSQLATLAYRRVLFIPFAEVNMDGRAVSLMTRLSDGSGTVREVTPAGHAVFLDEIW